MASKQCVVLKKYVGLAHRAHDDGLRYGLSGGDRDNGGAANVDNDHRDNRNQNIAVRLVLSRKDLNFNQ